MYLGSKGARLNEKIKKKRTRGVGSVRRSGNRSVVTSNSFMNYSFRDLLQPEVITGSPINPMLLYPARGETRIAKTGYTVFDKCMEKLNSKVPSSSQSGNMICPEIAADKSFKDSDLQFPKKRSLSAGNNSIDEFTADSCSPSHNVESNSLVDPAFNKVELNVKIDNTTEPQSWKASLKKYPIRSPFRPVLINHSPDDDPNFKLFEQAKVAVTENHNFSNEGGLSQHILFINENRWMSGKENVASNRTSPHNLSSSVETKLADAPTLNPDHAYLKNVLINLRSLQAKIEAEKLELSEDNLGEDEMKLDTNLSCEDLSNIINMCIQKSNRSVGFQVLYEILEHQELVRSKIDINVLIKIWDRLKNEDFSSETSVMRQNLLKRLESFLK